MCHKEKRGLVFQEKLLEPKDGFQVEVVRRFVEKQQVWLPGERAGEKRAPLEAARQIGEFARSGESDLMDEILDAHLALPVLLVARVRAEPSRDDVVDAAPEVRRNLLGQLGEDRAGRAENVARVRLHDTGDHPHEGCLSCPVSADKAHALARLELKIDVFQDGRPAEMKREVEQGEEGCHGGPAKLGGMGVGRKPGVLVAMLKLTGSGSIRVGAGQDPDPPSIQAANAAGRSAGQMAARRLRIRPAPSLMDPVPVNLGYFFSMLWALGFQGWSPSSGSEAWGVTGIGWGFLEAGAFSA